LREDDFDDGILCYYPEQIKEEGLMLDVANRLKSTAVLAWITGGAVAMLPVAATMVLAPREAAATPAYGQQTGMACGQCHVNPAGGGKLTTFGMNWQAKGHKLPGK
jgi:hypothetical protein